MRRRLVAGNWKMHGSRAANRALLASILGNSVPGAECAVCVPFPYLGEVAEQLRGSPIAWGAQNVSEHPQGAYTGEVSAAMVAEFGCRYAIVGHSERRQLHGETDAVVGAKARAALAAGLTPIACVGETLIEREGGKTEAVVERQLAALVAALGKDMAQIVLAYEPVWAIGTGRTAAPADAQRVHEALRTQLSAAGASAVSILYGGSVKASNAAA